MTQTALRLSQHPTLSLFLRSCITHIGNNVGLVPYDDLPRMLRSKHSGNKKGESGGNSTGLSALTTSYPLGHFLHQLLQKQGQPKGILIPANGSLGEIKFSWSVPPGQSRLCNTARIWRPSQAEHKSNGAWVSVTHQGEVNLICLHPQCLHRGCSNRLLIGYVPLSLLRHSTDMNEVQVLAGERIDYSKMYHLLGARVEVTSLPFPDNV